MLRVIFSLFIILLFQESYSEVVLYNKHIPSQIPICGSSVEGAESVAKQQAALQQFSRSSLLLLKNEAPPSAAGRQKLLSVMPEEPLNQRYPSCSAYLQARYRNLADAAAQNKQGGNGQRDILTYFMLSVYHWRDSQTNAMNPAFKAIMDDVLKDNRPLRDYILQELES